MTGHEKIRHSVSLAVAGGLEPKEDRILRTHLRDCEDCSRELAELSGVATALGQLPTPQPPEALVERVRRAMHLELAGQADDRLSVAWPSAPF